MPKINIKEITVLFIILLLLSIYATTYLTRKNTINEIYDYIDVQYKMCANSCIGSTEPAWINIRQGTAECTCLVIANNGNQTDNQIPTRNN